MNGAGRKPAGGRFVPSERGSLMSRRGNDDERTLGDRLSVLYAVTASMTAEAFLRGQMRSMGELGPVGLVVGDHVPEELVRDEGVVGYSIGVPRDPSPLSDLRALIRLTRIIATSKPTVVIFGTPKMGLLAAVATRLCRTPRRIYVVHGLRWEGLTGNKRLLLRAIERLVCGLATDVVAVSPSVRRRVVEDMAVSALKVRVLHHGSANGIDSTRFVPLPKGETRRSLGLPADAVLYAFVGRLTRDKGIRELPGVWTAVREQVPNAHLVVVGQAEPIGVEDELAIRRLNSMDSVTVCDATAEIERYLGASDVNLSLSRREGMPTVVLEAASCGVPTVGYRVTGLIDAVTAETGALVPLGSGAEIVTEAIRFGVEDEVRAAAGRAARARIQRDFAPTEVWDAWLRYLVSPETRLAGDQ